MQNEKFLNSLNKEFYVIYWSYWLKKLNRKPNDIDIYIRYSDLEYFEFLSKKYNFQIIWPWEVEVWPYWETDFIIEEFLFSDNSKIQLNLLSDFNDLKIDNFQWLKVLKENEILFWKLKNILTSPVFWDKQKVHLQDLQKYNFFEKITLK